MPHAMPIRQTGGPEVLSWTAVDVGEPRSGQVRMRQEAAGLHCIGVKGAGTVETVGPVVRGLMVGDAWPALIGPDRFAFKYVADAHKVWEARNRWLGHPD